MDDYILDFIRCPNCGLSAWLERHKIISRSYRIHCSDCKYAERDGKIIYEGNVIHILERDRKVLKLLNEITIDKQT